MYCTDGKKAQQLDGEPSASVSLGRVHYYTSLLARREKNRVRFNCPLV